MFPLLFACAAQDCPDCPGGAGRAEVELVAAGMPVLVHRVVRLDPGTFVDGVWVGGEESALRVVGPGGAVSDGRLELGIGQNVVTVERACGPVSVEVRADPAVEVVSVPFLVCAAAVDALAVPGTDVRLDRRERTVSDVLALQSLGTLRSVPLPPGTDDLPARYLSRDEAEAACGFYGGRLPSAVEFAVARGQAVGPRGSLHGVVTVDRAPTLGPAGHEDLGGNVAEWLLPDPADGPGADGPVAGPSFLRPDLEWTVPAEARSEEIGFRCAYGN